MSAKQEIVADRSDAVLVLQGTAVELRDVETVARLTAARRIACPAPNVYKLSNAQSHEKLQAMCNEFKLDFAFVPATLNLSYFKLVAMDMDSTLINIETLDEVADYAGLKHEIAAITEQSMNGAVDFAESLRHRVALLKGLDASALERVYVERLELNPGAEKFIATLKAHGIKTMLVSGGFTFFTERLKARLGLDFAHANTLEVVDGKLTGQVLGDIVDAQAKAYLLNHTRVELDLHGEQVIAIGDGANDLKMMAQAGSSIAYHAKPIVRTQASYALNFVGLNGLVNLFA